MRGANKYILFLLCGLLCAGTVFAYSTPTDIYNQMSSLATGAASNHRIVFTTPVEIPDTDTLTVAFPSGFILTSITEDDVDISAGGVDLTTASDSCAGSEQVDISVAGQNLVFSWCPGDGGAVGVATEVVIEIGRNASASGSGVNRVTNPTDAATYFMWLYTDTNNLSGSIPVVIVSDDDSTVSGVVPSSGGGGGGGGSSSSPAPDTSDDSSDDSSDETTDDSSDDSSDDTTDDSSDDSSDDTSDDSSDDSSDETSGDSSSGDGSSDSPTDSGSGTGPSEGSSGGTSTDGSDSGTVGDGDTPTPVDEEDEDTIDGSEQERLVETEITVGSGQITISDDALIPNSQAQLRVIVQDPESVTRVVTIVNDTTYGLVEVLEGEYQGLIPVGNVSQTVTILVDYDNGQTVTNVQTWDVMSYGRVYEVVDGARSPVSGAIVIVYEGTDSSRTQWDAERFGQSNPITTGTGGGFAFYVPNGTYTIRVGKTGYSDWQEVVRVSNNILTFDVELARLAIAQERQTPSTIIGVMSESVGEVAQAVNQIRELPQVQAAADVTTPVVVATAVTSAGVLSSSFNLFPFLRYLFSSPFLFFARRKRTRFGTVYNSITKVPIDLATIRLLSKDGKLIKTAVSDKHGRYLLRAKPGVYRIEIQKSGFDFPSQYLLQKGGDTHVENLYVQGFIEVKEQDVVVSANIPMDPSQQDQFHTSKTLIWKRFVRVLSHILALTGLVLATTIAFIDPSSLSIGLVVLHIVVYLITRALTHWRKKKGWGVVREWKGNRSIANTIVRLFEPQFHRLVESTITDGSGRYAFLVGPNQYYMTFEKPGYEKETHEGIDLSHKQEPDILSVDIALKKTTADAV